MSTPSELVTPSTGGPSAEPAGRDAGGAPVQTLPAPEVYAALDSTPHGPTTTEADARRLRFGANEMPRAARSGALRQLAAQFTDLFAVVLLIASTITFLAYALQDPPVVGTLQLAVAILCVVLLNAAIGFAQEYSAERTAESLQAMVPHTCRVLRDAVLQELPARELVQGDVVALEAGDAVSADMRALIAGAGRLGTQIAQVLAAAGNDVTLADVDADRIAALQGHLAARLLVGDACEPIFLGNAGAHTADLVIAVTGRDEDNLVIGLLAERQFAVPRVVARINDEENAWLFDQRWGIDIAVLAATPLISLIEEATGPPAQWRCCG